MKHIYLNLKRFDISPARGGVNRLAAMADWGEAMILSTREALSRYPNAAFTMFFPEAHILRAVAARTRDGVPRVGCQGVYRDDTAPGGNFGAFTSHLTANAAREMGCDCALIGHCEERADKFGLLASAGVGAAAAADAVNAALNQEILRAQAAGLDALYCVGEKSEEQAAWREVLGAQLDIGLRGVDTARVAVAYEPIWSIGPGKTPADREYIVKIARFIKERTGGAPVVYGGGLKRENAAMLASIDEIDGGLIALTRFSGEIGFYPDEYIDIIDRYLG